jgi:hypothetical protein
MLVEYNGAHNDADCVDTPALAASSLILVIQRWVVSSTSNL